MEIRDIFRADPFSIYQVLCENGLGLYIPPYQRHYSWDKSHISRLFEDVTHGLRLLVDNNDSITFIGTIIAIIDTKFEMVDPKVQSQLPGKVMHIIDGQQRLTTLTLINTLLHNEIINRSQKFKDDEEEAYRWIYNITRDVISELDKTYREDRNWGDDELQWYPKIIRAHDDQWSRLRNEAKYTSPIAAYLHTYSKHVFSKNYDIFNYNPDSEDNKHKSIINNFKLIKKTLRNLTKDKEEDIDMPKLTDIINKEDFQQTLLKMTFPDTVSEIIRKQSMSSKENSFIELLRMILFAKFILHRMSVTVVTAKNESYAFDMFESLNTTGEPLTAYETFKPLVIQSETLSLYETSASKKSMDIIESYLNKYTKAQEKQGAVNTMIIPFALAENGFKMSKRLSDQRRYLRDEYSSLERLDEKRDFVKHLSHTALFVKNAWPDNLNDKPTLQEIDDDLVLMCMDVLREANHNIIISLIARFFSQIRSVEVSRRDGAINEFGDTVKAVTAFLALWRSSRPTTENIDSYYRELMKDGFKEVNILPFSRQKNNNSLSVADVKTALKYVLKVKGGISSKNDWVNKAKDIQVYDVSKVITKFLLHAATHDSTYDPDNPGLPMCGRSGLLNMLSRDQWQINYTVEHVFPQSLPPKGWDQSLYDDYNLLNVLGNLTLLPMIENISAGDRAWKRKKLIYKVLAAPSEDALESLIDDAKSEGIEDLSKSTQEILRSSKYLPQVRAIGMVEGEWNAELVKKRSIRLAEIAWDRLSPWLGFEE